MEPIALRKTSLNPAAKAFTPIQKSHVNEEAKNTVLDDLLSIQHGMDVAPTRISDPTFGSGEQTTPSSLQLGVGTKSNIAGDPNKSELTVITEEEEEGMAQCAAANTQAQRLWAVYTKMEDSLNSMQVAGNDVLVYKNMIELNSEGLGSACDEVFRSFKKVLEQQRKIVEEVRTRMDEMLITTAAQGDLL